MHRATKAKYSKPANFLARFFARSSKAQIISDAISAVLLLASFVGMVYLLVKSSMPSVYLRSAFVEVVADLNAAKGGRGTELSSAALARVASQVLAQVCAYGLVLLLGAIKLLLTTFKTSNDVIVEKRLVCERQTYYKERCKGNEIVASFSVNAIRLLS